MHLANHVDEASEHCEKCRAFDKAPHVPIADTPVAPMSHRKLHVGLPFLGDIYALHAMDVCSKHSLLLLGKSQNPQEVWGAFCGGCMDVFGQLRSIQMDECREWQNEIRTDVLGASN